MSILFPDEQREMGSCELCGEELERESLSCLDGHFLCPRCARLVRNDGVVLPPGGLGRKRGFSWFLRESKTLGILLALFVVMFIVAKFIIRYHERAKWNPYLAEASAVEDYSRGILKIYFEKGISNNAIGVEASENYLLEGIPCIETSIEADASDEHLLKQRREYYSHYNRAIMGYLKKHPTSGVRPSPYPESGGLKPLRE